MAGEAQFETLLADGRATAEGDVAVLGQLAALMVEFDPRFPIMPGTGPRVAEGPTEDPFAAEIGAVIPE
jgi:hypothetical protein